MNNLLTAIHGKGFDHEIVDSEGHQLAKVFAWQSDSFELAQVLAAGPAFLEALTDDDDKSLWVIGHIETLVREYEREHNWKADEDPSATDESIQTVVRACKKIRAIIAQAKGEVRRERDHV